jgi:Rrf2 family transcriptional regulator, cysteine metabolism repressor
MFHLSSRSLYALKALYELAQHELQPIKTPLKIATIAQRQKIPARFLEGILAQLKRGGFVESRRGVDGGYQLTRQAQHLTIGEVMRFLEGPLDFTNSQKKGRKAASLSTRDPFQGFWQELETAVAVTIDAVTLGELVEDNQKTGDFVPNYEI